MSIPDREKGLSLGTLCILQALRAAPREHEDTDADGATWKGVYLDNVRRDVTPTAFRSALAALARRGLYKSLDAGAFGEVRMPESMK